MKNIVYHYTEMKRNKLKHHIGMQDVLGLTSAGGCFSPGFKLGQT